VEPWRHGPYGLVDNSIALNGISANRWRNVDFTVPIKPFSTFQESYKK
jgi:hypothetical protein